MLADISEFTLHPGSRGAHCPGNGMARDTKGNPIECCCDECDYMLECFPECDIAAKKEI